MSCWTLNKVLWGVVRIRSNVDCVNFVGKKANQCNNEAFSIVLVLCFHLKEVWENYFLQRSTGF